MTKCNEKLIHTMISAGPKSCPTPITTCCTEEPAPINNCDVIQKRWVRNPELDYCEKDEFDHNTGTLFIFEYEEEKINDGDWYANGNTR